MGRASFAPSQSLPRGPARPRRASDAPRAWPARRGRRQAPSSAEIGRQDQSGWRPERRSPRFCGPAPPRPPGPQARTKLSQAIGSRESLAILRFRLPRWWPPWSPRLTLYGGSVKAMPAFLPASTRSMSAGNVASPTRSRCSPRAHRSPGLIRGARVASSRAESRSKSSTRSFFSRVSRLRSRSRISSSPNPDSERSIVALVVSPTGAG